MWTGKAKPTTGQSKDSIRSFVRGYLYATVDQESELALEI